MGGGPKSTKEPTASPRLHVVSAPVGGGKTSFSLAFVGALVRNTPFACLVVVNQIEKADATFRELKALLPGKVAVWTTEHDPDCKVPEEQRKVTAPAAQFAKDDLQHYPVAVITHAFFSSKGNRKATHVVHSGRLQPRALTVIDERIEEVTVFDVALSAAQKVREVIMANEQHAEVAGPHIEALVDFMWSRSKRGPDIEKPTDDAAWNVARSIQWFATGTASDFVRDNPGIPDVQAVFGFGKALANGYAFIARNSGNEKATHYIGYESNIVIRPGSLLLDATADIDGVSQLCTWRQHNDVPQARYDNLHVVSVAPHTKKRLSNYLATARNRRDYVAWMVDVINTNMQPGQKGLVVCKHTLFENENVPNWPADDPRHRNHKLFSEQFGWDSEGRMLCATHWGTGIGYNTWMDADVVFLFDEFFVPRRTVIATAQGLQGHKATEGALKKMKVLNSPAHAVDTLWEGHLLRWLKQMALRGNGRNFDEHGICGHQKLVCSADRTRLLANVDRLFPGARIEIVAAHKDAKRSDAGRVLEILSGLGLPNIVTTKWIGQQMGKPWRSVSKHVMNRPTFRKALENLGWTYVTTGRGGRRGAHFERIGITTAKITTMPGSELAVAA
jgi:hypothetical protein